MNESTSTDFIKSAAKDISKDRKVREFQVFVSGIEADREKLFAEMIRDPLYLFDALSLDGVPYPFTRDHSNASADYRARLINREREFDAMYATHLADLIEQEDHAELGRLIARQVTKYINERVSLEL